MRRERVLRAGVVLVLINSLVILLNRPEKVSGSNGFTLSSSIPDESNGKGKENGEYQASKDIFANMPASFVRRAKYFSGVDLPEFRLPEFQGFLESENRNSDALVAVYLLTNDNSLLNELKKHTGSAEAMLCLARASSVPLEERKTFAQIYCELNPHQMQGYLVAASLYLEEGKGAPKDRDAFLSLIQSGMNADEFSFGLDSVAENQRKALEFIGTDRLDTEALLASVNYKADEILFYARNVLVFASSMESAMASDETEKVEVIKTYLSIAESFGELSKYSSLNGGEGRHIGLMNELLHQLPPEAQLGDEWGTVETLQKRLKFEWDGMMEDTRIWGDFLTNSLHRRSWTIF